MTCLPDHSTRARLERVLRRADPGCPEISIVELVLFASEASEDVGEIGDLVAAMIEAGAARVLPQERDPLLIQLEG